MPVDLVAPLAVEGFDDRDLRLWRKLSVDAAELLHLGADLREFIVAAVRLPVVRKNAVPVLFRPEEAGPPAEEDNGVRAVRHGRVGPQPQLPGLRHRSELRPADGAGLLLHDPVGRVLVAPEERLVAGDAGVLGDAPLEVDVVIPGDKIQRFAELEIIDPRPGVDAGVEEIRRDRAVAVLPDDVDLLVHKRDDAVRREAVEIEHKRRILPLRPVRIRPGARALLRHDDLGKVIVVFTPEDGPVGPVQHLDASVLFPQVLLKCLPAFFAVTARRVRPAELVVDLPPLHRGMRAVPLRDHGDELPVFLPVYRAVEAVVLSRSERADAPALVLLIERLAVLVAHPLGRRRGRRAEHGLHVVLCKEIKDFIHPFEMVLALARFIQRPVKLADAHDGDAALVHELKICLPALFFPVFRIIICSDSHISLLFP